MLLGSGGRMGEKSIQVHPYKPSSFAPAPYIPVRNNLMKPSNLYISHSQCESSTVSLFFPQLLVLLIDDLTLGFCHSIRFRPDFSTRPFESFF